jgi:hypothetical protein
MCAQVCTDAWSLAVRRYHGRVGRPRLQGRRSPSGPTRQVRSGNAALGLKKEVSHKNKIKKIKHTQKEKKNKQQNTTV